LVPKWRISLKGRNEQDKGKEQSDAHVTLGEWGGIRRRKRGRIETSLLKHWGEKEESGVLN